MGSLTALGRALTARSDELAEALVERHYLEHPEVAARYGAAGRTKCLRDAQYHIAYLAEAALHDRPAMWHQYVEWARSMLFARHVPIEDLERNLDCLRRVLEERLPASEAACALLVMKSTPAREPASETLAPFRPLESGQPHAQLAAAYLEALLAGDRHAASQMILDAIDGGVPVRDIYINVLQRSQNEIGLRWQLDRVSVGDEHYCTAATQMVMSQLLTRIYNPARAGRSMVAAAVGGDLHEIGARIVSDFFEMEGWDTYYLGANTPSETLLSTVRARRPDLVAISVTIPFHVSEAARLIAMLRSAGLDRVPLIMVGGAAFAGTDTLWQEIGADATAEEASQVVALATKLLASAA